MSQSKRYRTWLWEQRGRQDPVGDLARDAWEDRKGWTGMTSESHRGRLSVMGACSEARRAFDEAVVEWHDEQVERRVVKLEVAPKFYEDVAVPPDIAEFFETLLEED